MTDDFQQFLEARKKAAQAYVNGDFGPLSELAASTSPASFFSPMGDVTEGGEAVAARYERDAGAFNEGSASEIEMLHYGSSGDLGYWVGYQVADVRMKGRPGPVEMRIRVTEILRRDNGRWKMIHRHADMPKPQQ